VSPLGDLRNSNTLEAMSACTQKRQDTEAAAVSNPKIRHGTRTVEGVPQAHLGACCLDAEHLSDSFEGLEASQLVFTALVGLIVL
jgi:hypothetical protein